MLIFAGVLIATGAMSPFEFIPIAVIAMYGGSFIGYSWARRVGGPALQRLAERLHAGAGYTSAVRRMQRASIGSIVLARLIPAVRIQATLAAGAAAIDRRLFLIADAIGIALWLGLLTTLGWLLGVPAEHFLGQAFSLLISGGVLLLLGVAAYQIARQRVRLPPEAAAPIHGVPAVVRLLLAIALDIGIIAVLVGGLERIAAFVTLIDKANLSLPLVPDALYDLLVIAGVAAVGYLVVTRLSLRATIGERLFDVRYRRPRRTAGSTS